MGTEPNIVATDLDAPGAAGGQAKMLLALNEGVGRACRGHYALAPASTPAASHSSIRARLTGWPGARPYILTSVRRNLAGIRQGRAPERDAAPPGATRTYGT
jgi:hypothetical protein